MPVWNPELYLKFGEERSRPALDLATRARVLLAAGPAELPSPAILDLGCGPGNSTAVLAATFPGARLTGLDSSPEMIAAAQKTELPARWVVADAALWTADDSFDLVFSNAALQWIPDQGPLLARMWSWLAPGGVLAVQVPGNSQSGLHRALLRTAGQSRWAVRFSGLDDALRYHEPSFYFETLADLGARADVWESTYWHVLANRRALIDWYSGTGMRPWLERLADSGERAAFQDAVLEAAAPDYPERADGSVFFPFRRIFITAAKQTKANKE